MTAEQVRVNKIKSINIAPTILDVINNVENIII